MSWFVVRVFGGRGKFRQVILAGVELLRFPGVGASLGVQLGVSKHFVKPGVVVGAVHRRIDIGVKGGLVMGSG